MTLIADILMAAGSLGAAIYCYVLALRLKKFSTLESGMGGAIAVLSVQVDDMTKALDKARDTAGASANGLEGITARAEAAATRLELMVAALHDLPETSVESENEFGRKLRVVRRRPSHDRMEAAE